MHTYDLVVLACEWGSGRRQGMLSNLHLGARDPEGEFGDPGAFVMVGKTFKGLTDELLRWQTEYFPQIEVRRTAGTVWVAPTTVVEIAIDGVQRSSRYPAGSPSGSRASNGTATTRTRATPTRSRRCAGCCGSEGGARRSSGWAGSRGWLRLRPPGPPMRRCARPRWRR